MLQLAFSWPLEPQYFEKFSLRALQSLSSNHFHVQTSILLASRALVFRKIYPAGQSNICFKIIFMLKLAFSSPLEPYYFEKFPLRGNPMPFFKSFSCSNQHSPGIQSLSILKHFPRGAIQSLSSNHFHVRTSILLASRALVFRKIPLRGNPIPFFKSFYDIIFTFTTQLIEYTNSIKRVYQKNMKRDLFV